MSAPAIERVPQLSDRARAIIDFEKMWWSLPASKESEIRERFGMSSTRYYQELNALIDTEAALAYDPLLVKRLRRLRVQRQKERTAKRLGIKIPS